MAGAVSETLGITDTNYYTKNTASIPDGKFPQNEVVAILGVIGKADGPIIQRMSTTQEIKRSVSLEVVMPKSQRKTSAETDAGSPNYGNPVFPPRVAANAVVDNYKPLDGIQQSKSETWDLAKGSYQVQIEWVY